MCLMFRSSVYTKSKTKCCVFMLKIMHFVKENRKRIQSTIELRWRLSLLSLLSWTKSRVQIHRWFFTIESPPIEMEAKMKKKKKCSIEKGVGTKFSFVNFVQCIKFDYVNSSNTKLYTFVCLHSRNGLTTQEQRHTIIFTKSKYALNKSICQSSLHKFERNKKKKTVFLCVCVFNNWNMVKNVCSRWKYFWGFQVKLVRPKHLNKSIV